MYTLIPKTYVKVFTWQGCIYERYSCLPFGNRLQATGKSKSQQQIGNNTQGFKDAGLAIDFNLYKDNDVSKGTIPGNARVTSSNSFINEVKDDASVRFGGDFKKKDPVHIDQRNSHGDYNAIRDEDQAQTNGNNETQVQDKYIKKTITLYVLPPDKKKE